MAFRRWRFAQRRKALGHTQESLAAALGVERSTVVRWESGQNDPQPWIRPKIAATLRITLNQLANLLDDPELGTPLVARNTGQDDNLFERNPAEEVETAKRRAFVVGSLATLGLGLTDSDAARLGGTAVTTDLAADIRAAAASYRRAYRVAPARQLHACAQHHLAFVQSLRPCDQSPVVRRELVITAGETATLCAVVLGLDLGHWSDVSSYLDLAHRAAIEMAYPELEAVVLAARAFHAAYGLGDRQLGLEFAEAAVTVSRKEVSATTRGWVAAVASERHADLDDEAASHRLLDSARAALTATPDGHACSGIGSFDLAKLTAYEGGNYRRLGDYDNAIRVLDAALAELDPSMRRHRTTAFIDRAEAHHGAGNIDAACEDTRAALVLVTETQHADSAHRAETLASSMLASNARNARQLWKDVLTLKMATMAGQL